MRDYDKGIPLNASAVAGCPDSCGATVKAPALAVTRCISQLSYINYSEPLTKHEKSIAEAGVPPHSRSAFGSYWWTLNGTTEHLAYQTLISDKEVAEVSDSSHFDTKR